MVALKVDVLFVVGGVEVEGGLEDEGSVVGRVDEDVWFVCAILDTEMTNI